MLSEHAKTWEIAAKAALSSIAAALAWLFGGWDTLLTVAVIMIAADYFTGVIAAGIAGKLDSSVGWRGIWKKVLIAVVIALAAQMDRLLGSESAFRSLACLFYIGNEGISIIENLNNAGIPFPKKLADLFERLKSDNDNPTGFQ